MLLAMMSVNWFFYFNCWKRLILHRFGRRSGFFSILIFFLYYLVPFLNREKIGLEKNSVQTEEMKSRLRNFLNRCNIILVLGRSDNNSRIYI
jgi:hypothetical protein